MPWMTSGTEAGGMRAALMDQQLIVGIGKMLSEEILRRQAQPARLIPSPSDTSQEGTPSRTICRRLRKRGDLCSGLRPSLVMARAPGPHCVSNTIRPTSCNPTAPDEATCAGFQNKRITRLPRKLDLRGTFGLRNLAQSGERQAPVKRANQAAPQPAVTELSV